MSNESEEFEWLEKFKEKLEEAENEFTRDEKNESCTTCKTILDAQKIQSFYSKCIR